MAVDRIDFTRLDKQVAEIITRYTPSRYKPEWNDQKTALANALLGLVKVEVYQHWVMLATASTPQDIRDFLNRPEIEPPPLPKPPGFWAQLFGAEVPQVNTPEPTTPSAPEEGVGEIYRKMDALVIERARVSEFQVASRDMTHLAEEIKYAVELFLIEEIVARKDAREE